jgi:hypothetical protein
LCQSHSWRRLKQRDIVPLAHELMDALKIERGGEGVGVKREGWLQEVNPVSQPAL